MNETGPRQPGRVRWRASVNTRSKRQWIAILGTVIFSVGLLSGLYLSYLTVAAEVKAAFAMMASDMPTKPLKDLRCPTLLARNESGTVTAILDRAPGYSVYLSAAAIFDDSYDDSPVTLSGPESTRGKLAPSERGDNWLCSGCTCERVQVTLPPGETVDLTWRVSVTDDMQGEQIALKLYAFGEGDDRTYSDVPFRAWDFSYTGSCGIAIINLFGLTGKQTIVLTLLSMLLGGVMWLYGSVPLNRLGRAGVIIGGLLWLIILWRLASSGLGPDTIDTILSILTCAVMPLLVLAILIVLAISVKRLRG